MARKAKGLKVAQSDEADDIDEILTLVDDLEAGLPTSKSQWVTTMLRKIRVDLKHLKGLV
jgi:hypothetical protein